MFQEFLSCFIIITIIIIIGISIVCSPSICFPTYRAQVVAAVPCRYIQHQSVGIIMYCIMCCVCRSCTTRGCTSTCPPSWWLSIRRCPPPSTLRSLTMRSGQWWRQPSTTRRDLMLFKVMSMTPIM